MQSDVFRDRCSPREVACEWPWHELLLCLLLSQLIRRETFSRIERNEDEGYDWPAFRAKYADPRKWLNRHSRDVLRHSVKLREISRCQSDIIMIHAVQLSQLLILSCPLR